MKMQNLILIIFVLLCSGSFYATELNEIQEIKMETFDIERFERNRVKNGPYVYKLKDGRQVKEYGGGGTYFREISKENDLLIDKFVFYANGKLEEKGKEFPRGVALGTWRDYDKEGKLIEKTNLDKPFKYSWDDILKLCKERNINVLDYRTNIDRYIDEDNKKPYWRIRWLELQTKDEQVKNGFLPFKEIKINGVTGEIVKEYRLNPRR